MDVLIDLTLRDVYKLTEDKSNWDLYKFLQGIGVFQKNRACPENGCGRDMKLRPPVGRRQYGTWCCPRKNCRKTLGALSGTFFEGARLGLVEIFHLSFLWCLGIYTYDAIKSELRRSDGTKISQATVVDYCNFFRDVCCKHYQKNEILIGGPGVVIEIDETVISRRKYNRGRLVGDQWYFGGVERGSGRCFLEAVDRRDAHTLLNILKKHVLPGSIVVSDGWAAYGGIESLPDMESDWFLERRDSGCLVWCRKAAKVKFRCEVDVLEFWPGEYEKKWEPCCWDRAEPKMETSGFAAALCLAVICMVIGFKVYC